MASEFGGLRAEEQRSRLEIRGSHAQLVNSFVSQVSVSANGQRPGLRPEGREDEVGAVRGAVHFKTVGKK